MSSFWDSIVNGSTAEVIEEEPKTNFWASLGISSTVAEPVKKAVVKAVKITAKQSKKTAQAEQVYETIEGLVVPNEDCIHYWILPSNTDNPTWTIGVCKECKGEKWFSNRFIEQPIFNDTLVHPKVEQESIDSLYNADIMDMQANYNAEMANADGESE